MTDAQRPQRLLGLDVGERRIGVAVSEGTIAVPLSIIDHTKREADIERILAIAEERAVDGIIVGLPVSVSGEEGEQARLVRRFGEQLSERSSVAVVFHDEMYSSVDAAAAAGGGRRAPRHLDDRAAAVILQRYIDEQERA